MRDGIAIGNGIVHVDDDQGRLLHEFLHLWGCVGVILSYQAIVENRVPAGGPQQEALLLLAQAGGLNLGYEVIGLIAS